VGPIVLAAPAAEWPDLLRRGAEQLGLEVSQAEIRSLGLYLDLLLEHNRRAGLTAITDPADIALKHFLDSLTCLLAHDIAAGERVADVGSGAGLPGLVLAIARPQASYTLIESSARRAAFLRLAARELRLANVAVAHGRAEELGRQPEHRERYDLVVGRAVAPLPVLLEYCLPLARVDGRVIAQKGPAGESELARAGGALATLGGRLTDLHRLELPQGAGARLLVVVQKAAATPDKYPRRPGIPAKRPL